MLSQRHCLMKSHPASVFHITLPVVALVEKNLPANAGDVRDMGLIPGSRRSPGGGHCNPLQYSCWENPMDRRTWRATAHGGKESDTTEVTWHAPLTKQIHKVFLALLIVSLSNF